MKFCSILLAAACIQSSSAMRIKPGYRWNGTLSAVPIPELSDAHNETALERRDWKYGPAPSGKGLQEPRKMAEAKKKKNKAKDDKRIKKKLEKLKKEEEKKKKKEGNDSPVDAPPVNDNKIMEETPEEHRLAREDLSGALQKLRDAVTSFNKIGEDSTEYPDEGNVLTEFLKELEEAEKARDAVEKLPVPAANSTGDQTELFEAVDRAFERKMLLFNESSEATSEDRVDMQTIYNAMLENPSGQMPPLEVTPGIFSKILEYADRNEEGGTEETLPEFTIQIPPGRVGPEQASDDEAPHENYMVEVEELKGDVYDDTDPSVPTEESGKSLEGITVEDSNNTTSDDKATGRHYRKIRWKRPNLAERDDEPSPLSDIDTSNFIIHCSNPPYPLGARSLKAAARGLFTKRKIIPGENVKVGFNDNVAVFICDPHGEDDWLAPLKCEKDTVELAERIGDEACGKNVAAWATNLHGRVIWGRMPIEDFTQDGFLSRVLSRDH